MLNMKTSSTIVGFVITAAIGGAIGYAIRDAQDVSKSPKKIQAEVRPLPPSDAKDKETVYKVPVGDAHVKGPSDALVTIVEFSDFQCPFCARVLPTLDQVRKTYGDDVRIAFRHNPLPFHKDAPLASEYVLAAGAQGKFWEMHDEVFANQKTLKEDDLNGMAEKIGLDLAEVKAFIASGKGKEMIAEDQKLARQIGSGGTPSFFINGVKLSGAQPFPAFKRVIDARLAEAKALVAQGVARKDVYAKLTANGRTTPAPDQNRKRRAQEPPDTRQNLQLADHAPAKGGDNPLVTIVEFSDFQCPFCSRVNPSLKKVMETYGDDVQIRFRHLPLGFHKRALPAAKASMAAAKQGKFWEMHDLLFSNQKALEDDDLNAYAKQLGLDVQRFKRDMNSKEVADQVAADQAAASKVGARGTPTLFVNGVPVRGAQPFPRFKVVIDKEIALAKKLMESGVKRADVYEEVLKREAGKGGTAQAPTPAAEAEPVEIELGRAPIDGDKNAPIQVVMYSDFQCPFCSRVNPSIDQMKEEYGDKVVVAFKHYPLPFHKDAKPAAIASLAAHRQGKFWEMHEKLFANQRNLNRDAFVNYAKELGLDTAKFEKDLDDPALAQWVAADMAEAQKFGVRGTPATFINGRLVSGAQPYPRFKALIDAELDNS